MGLYNGRMGKGRKRSAWRRKEKNEGYREGKGRMKDESDDRSTGVASIMKS